MRLARASRSAFAGVCLMVLALGLACRGGQSEYPILPTEELVQEGATIYAANCVTCHGNASGQDRRLGAPPHNAAGHTWHHADRLLVEWVLDGPPLRTAMPAFRGTLTEQEVRAAIAYIKTFWPQDIQQSQITFSELYEEQLKDSQ